MFPGPLLAGASGLLFGTALGFPVTLASAVLGASIAFTISRYVAPDAVEQLAGPRLAAIEELVSRRGFVSVLYARIAPGVPYSLVNYAAGLTRIPLAVFAAATAIGTAPRAFAYTALGGSLGNLRSPEAAIAVAVLVVMGSLGLGAALPRAPPGAWRLGQVPARGRAPSGRRRGRARPTPGPRRPTRSGTAGRPAR